MESEKVKEIKLALKKNIKLGLSYENDEKYCKVWLADILTLINELESENKTLLKSKTMWKRLHTELCEENQQLKDRIAELEKGNAKLLDSVETVQSNRCVYKCVLTKEHLTKFAERLKEKFYYVFGNEYEQSVSGFDTKVLIEHIDETLKEFIDD